MAGLGVPVPVVGMGEGPDILVRAFAVVFAW